jgi:threonine dehydratase
VVSLEEVEYAVRDLAMRALVVAAGAAAVSVAAARRKQPELKKTVCVISGGNIDAAVLAPILTQRGSGVRTRKP